MPDRIHFINEWAKKREISQADICRALDVDKGLVSRWFTQGVVPNTEYREQLAALLGTDVHGLFMHPDQRDVLDFFRDKSPAQVQQALNILRAAFPQ